MNFVPNLGQTELIRRIKSWWKTLEKPMFVFSGGPGTGKTTTLKYVIEDLGISLDNVIGIAYSGKAVNVIAGATVVSGIFQNFGTLDYFWAAIGDILADFGNSI